MTEDIELANTPIFTQEDFLLYRGVVNFYLKQYPTALLVNSLNYFIGFSRSELADEHNKNSYKG